MKAFAYCKCFYEQNIFIRGWNKHVLFKNEEQFRKDYGGEENLDSAMAEARAEVERRIDAKTSCLVTRENISANFSPSIDIDSAKTVFQKGFLEASKWARDHQDGAEMPPNVTRAWRDVFTVPVFSEDFCQNLVSELQRFKNSGLVHSQPNSMNRNGILIDEFPCFDTFVERFRSKLAPIFKKLFSNFSPPDVSFDSHKAFVVEYRLEGDNSGSNDIELAEHFDNAEITINVALTKNYEGGEIVFNDGQRFGMEHKLGVGIIHLGSLLHQAMPIYAGQRSNLIVWVRSSQIRNRKCPMCLNVPDLIPALGSAGDGFTISDQNNSTSLVCSIA